MASPVYWYTTSLVIKVLVWWFVPGGYYDRAVLIVEVVLALIFLWETIQDLGQNW